MRVRRHFLFLLALLTLGLGLPSRAHAHLGSPDVFYEGNAGPYKLFVTIRPPEVIPGVADVQVRAATADITELRIVPLPLLGDSARFAPIPDVAVRSPEDSQSFSGHLWMMTAGTWQVRILVDGQRGSGLLAVPVPTLPKRTRGMELSLALLLLVLLFVLVFGLISIIGAGAGEARLDSGLAVDAAVQRRARRAKMSTGLLILAALAGGALWWKQESAKYDSYIYKPLAMRAAVSRGRLELSLSDPGWQGRKLDDLLPDHNHLMHLFMLRLPELEQVWHLHPTSEGAGHFGIALPPIAAGSYRLYADIVHATGLQETLVAELSLPSAIAGQPLTGDDATGSGPPLGLADPARTVAPLTGSAATSKTPGPQMVWLADSQPYVARTPYWFRFRVEDRPGHPAEDLELYMGMLGHAAFVKRDGSVFAHVHPSGSVPMATLGLTVPAAAGHAMHHATGALPAEVSFPFGFPQPGDYRVIVQVKRRAEVATAIFDIHVEPAARR